ncbi:hypothetical protein E2C01_054815 [Portunus trituberculatus]|uniref:Uncharacterized protein n=1 Tax=Portunus trituberculatus TaxID=210409 RepID=A0A5B7GSY3_PORTR|nr:hypothetical protein [Portunus trituberculatus]
MRTKDIFSKLVAQGELNSGQRERVAVQGPATMHMTAASHRQINGRRDTLLSALRTPSEKRGSVVGGSCNQVNEHQMEM